MDTDSPKVKTSLLLVSSLTIASMITISASLPDMSAHFSDLPGGPALVKLSLSLPALFIALTATLAGAFIDRAGRLKLLGAALVLYADRSDVCGRNFVYNPGWLYGRYFMGNPFPPLPLRPGHTSFCAPIPTRTLKPRYLNRYDPGGEYKISANNLVCISKRHAYVGPIFYTSYTNPVLP